MTAMVGSRDEPDCCPLPTGIIATIDDGNSRACKGDCKFQGAQSCRTCYPDAGA
jgi:hypothetical protein